MYNLLSCHQRIAGFNNHVRLQPFLRREQNIRISGKGCRVHIHMNNKIQLLDCLRPASGLGNYAQLIAGTVNPHPRLIWLPCDNRIQNAARMTCIPNGKPFMLPSAETFFILLRRQAFQGDRYRIVWHLQHPAGAEPLHQRTRPLHIAQQEINRIRSHSSLYGVRRLVCSHSQADTAGRIIQIHADCRLDAVFFQPAKLRRFLKCKLLAPFKQKLHACLIYFPIHFPGSPQSGLKIFIIRIGKGLHGICFFIPYHKSIRLSVLPFCRSLKKARFHIHEIRKICPALHKILIIFPAIQNIANPCHLQGNVSTRTDWQPDIRL